MFDTFRYYIALALLVMLPPALFLWFVIHPFARFWRRFGAGVTYGVLSVPVLLIMATLFLSREILLSVEYGTSYVLIALAAVSLFVGGNIAWKRAKYLSFGILSGLPELSPRRYPGKLINEGIYSRLRHPRYVEILFFTLGYSLFANYLALYVMLLLCLPTLFLVVLLEERELKQRFGTAYDDYCRRVPRFLPRFRSGVHSTDSAQPGGD